MAANTTRHLTVSMATETAAARSRAPVRFLAKIEGMVDETGTEWFDIGEKIAIAQRCEDSGGGMEWFYLPRTYSIMFFAKGSWNCER